MRKTLGVVTIALCGALLCSCGPDQSYSAEKMQKAQDETLIVGQEASGRRLLADGEYTAEAMGMEGPIQVEVRVRDGFIDRVKVLDHQENVGIVEDAFDRLSRKVIKSQSANLDAVSGATEASNGFLEAVRECIRQAGAEA